MTFALRKNRAEVVRNIANLRSFAHGGSRSGGEAAISGRTGGTTRLGALPRQYAHGLAEAVYVVYCYGTPIAWVTMADDATEEGRVNFMPDWQYSATTTYHQGLVWEAWGDKIVDPNPRYSKAENRGTERGRSSDARYNRGNARAQEQARFAEREARRAAQPRETHYARPYTESSMQDRMQHLLDPRYRNPDWTPEPLPEGAERRDAERVRDSSGYSHPAHP